MINMIPRFYDATKGEVLVDGVNVKEYTQKALRNKIGYVSQKAVLFTGSIKSNVAYGDNGTKGFTDDVVKQAIETAQAKEFVDKTDGGVDAFVAQEDLISQEDKSSVCQLHVRYAVTRRF